MTATARDAAIFTRLDALTGVVLELTRARYYLFNETSALIVELVCQAGSITLAELVEKLAETYEVDEATLVQDVLSCLEELQLRRIVELTSGA